MANSTNHSFSSLGALQTEEFACLIGKQLQGGETIELIGDVGAGKTTFVRGLARGIGSKDIVSSPTFTIKNVYKGRLDLCHYDLYRLHNDELIKREIAEMVDSSERSVTVIEWAQDAQGVLPTEHIRIEIRVSGETERLLVVAMPMSQRKMNLS